MPCARDPVRRRRELADQALPCSLTKTCALKCVPTDYRESELNKGESVCLDRCAAKFFDVHMKVSEILQKETQQRGGAGGGFGFGG